MAGGAGLGAAGAVAVDGGGTEHARPDFPGRALRVGGDCQALARGEVQSDGPTGLEQGVVGGVVEGVQTGRGAQVPVWAWAAGVGAFFSVATGTVEFPFGAGDRLVVGRAGLGRDIGFAGDLAPAPDVTGQGPQVGGAPGMVPVAGAYRQVFPVGAGDDEFVQRRGAFLGQAQGGQEPAAVPLRAGAAGLRAGTLAAGSAFPDLQVPDPPRMMRVSGVTMRCQGTSSTRVQGARSIRADVSSAVTHRGAMLRSRALAERLRTVLAVMGEYWASNPMRAE
ncbi:hypothetical protein M2283_008406 [Streptomyces pseudovenezuelae]|uniref:Uncharacterized protein n=1 Tax=Streptomyces pseudovenezuelae TaxID=67350 RepID=A0ABT6LXP0_9ACTN|nr:hypothetical protein [Streptomyces pseudovenezuelae]